MRQDSIPLSLIRTDGGTQCRAFIDQHVVQEYADAVRSGATFPPVVVFFDGSEYWLADGFHRVAAHAEAEREEIDVDQHEGSQRDAVLHAAGANADHGLRRTNADKRVAVERLLRDPEWVAWSNREIGRRCAVDEKTVRLTRERMSAELPQIDKRKATRNGTTYEVDTTEIGGRDLHEGERDEDGNLVLPPVERRAGERPGLSDQLKQGLNADPKVVERYHDGLLLDQDLSQWFTPEDLADVVAELACHDAIPMSVLEPAAGDGALIDGLIRVAGTEDIAIDAVELDPRWCERLERRAFVTVDHANYLERPAPAEPYDVVVQNPPFERLHGKSGPAKDGLFVAKAMDESLVVVAVLRTTALGGKGRFEGVWGREDWGVTHLRFCAGRPSFGSGAPRHDFCVVRLERGATTPDCIGWLFTDFARGGNDEDDDS